MLKVVDVKGKKGISPIIATIILIGFVVLLIVLIWIWSRNVYEERAEKEGALAQEQIRCNEVLIELERIGGTVNAINVGSLAINGFLVSEDIGSEGSRLSNIYVDVGVGDTFPLSQSSVTCAGSVEPDTPGALCGNADSATIIPALQPEGRGAPLVPCSNSNVVLEL